MASPTVLYVGTEDGVHVLRSDDGDRWEVQPDTRKQVPREWAVRKLTTDRSRPNRVFAGTRGDGVWVSEDYGRTWDKPSYGRLGPGKVRCVAVDPHEPDTIYAGTEPIDLWVSHDVGKRWERLASVWDVPSVESVKYTSFGTEPHLRHIAMDPKRRGTIYAGLQVGYMIKSTDAGQSWNLLTNGLDNDVHWIEVSHTNTAEVYVATGGHFRGEGLYKSVDGGESWFQLRTAEFGRRFSVSLAMHPTDARILFTSIGDGHSGQWRTRPSGAESMVIRTKDGGATWERLEKGLEETERDYAYTFAHDPSSPDRVYAGFISGDVYRSEDCGDSWSKLDVKVPTTYLYDMTCVHEE